jgi:hypothetical protein
MGGILDAILLFSGLFLGLGIGLIERLNRVEGIDCSRYSWGVLTSDWVLFKLL